MHLEGHKNKLFKKVMHDKCLFSRARSTYVSQLVNTPMSIFRAYFWGWYSFSNWSMWYQNHV